MEDKYAQRLRKCKNHSENRKLSNYLYHLLLHHRLLLHLYHPIFEHPLAGNIGQLFIQAMQTTSAFDSQRPELTPDEYKQSQLILGSIKDYMKQEYGQKVTNRIVRAAIINLLKELENELN